MKERKRERKQRTHCFHHLVLGEMVFLGCSRVDFVFKKKQKGAKERGHSMNTDRVYLKMMKVIFLIQFLIFEVN